MADEFETDNTHGMDGQQLAIFEDRYGAGSFERLLSLLRQPQASFAQIATQFGVSRERVRQWHVQWLPTAPTGRQRQHLRAALQQKRRLLADSLFRSFHQHARAHFGAGRIHPVRSRNGYRTRIVRIDERLVALRDATDAQPRYRGRADFIFFRLSPREFLFVPAAARVAVDGDSADKRQRFANTFNAFHAVDGDARVEFIPKEQSL